MESIRVVLSSRSRWAFRKSERDAAAKEPNGAHLSSFPQFCRPVSWFMLSKAAEAVVGCRQPRWDGASRCVVV